MNYLFFLQIMIPIVCGVLICIFKKKAEKVLMLCGCLIETVLSIVLYIYGKDFLETVQIKDICSFGLSFRIDGFRSTYLLVSSIMWLVTCIYSFEYMKNEENTTRFAVFFMWTLATVAGVLMSADFFTTFVFFEMMSFTSFVWVIHEEDEGAVHAGKLYLSMSVISGLVMLLGIMLLYSTTKTLSMDMIKYKDFIGDALYEKKLLTAGILMLVGFGTKAGMFLLHVWLPKAHTVAPAPTSALLSGILTKMGIYGIIAISFSFLYNNEHFGHILLAFGILTMFHGAFLALFSDNLKKTLACSSVSQMGFILTGVSMSILLDEKIVAYSGTILHMINHSLIKLVLFLCAGIVMKKTGSLMLKDIKGYGRGKTAFLFAFATGAFAISGIPLGSGYISKTLIHESILEYLETISGTPLYGTAKFCEIMFIITGGMTFAYMTKLFVTLFIKKGTAISCEKGGKLSTLCTVIPSAVLLSMGFLPGIIMRFFADNAHFTTECLVNEKLPDISWFSFENLKGAGISILIGIAIYFVVCFKPKTLPKWFDLEKYVYEPLIFTIIPFLIGIVCRVFDKIIDAFALLVVGRALSPKRKKSVGAENDFSYKFVRDFSMGFTELARTENLVVQSLSFGLFLFCIGLLVTLIYLLF